MILYVAGPMSGIKDFNYPAFHAATLELRNKGYKPINPADNRPNTHGKTATWLDFMRMSVAQIATCDGVCTLPGFAGSRGAYIEVQLATGLGLPVNPLHEWLERPVLR